eukprot:TRINITY_DN1832_c0_g4_i1.p1 TRINITY_DN1832_c0_g4~~TRINITY_DN1832_c0_g4_i1.p1  ORF type:complete len:183 (-),score=63.19 TRINITY_DN1832_c0_g4_i1:73-621(-)
MTFESELRMTDEERLRREKEEKESEAYLKSLESRIKKMKNKSPSLPSSLALPPSDPSSLVRLKERVSLLGAGDMEEEEELVALPMSLFKTTYDPFLERDDDNENEDQPGEDEEDQDEEDDDNETGADIGMDKYFMKLDENDPLVFYESFDGNFPQNIPDSTEDEDEDEDEEQGAEESGQLGG